jgi:hypothetical protein
LCNANQVFALVSRGGIFLGCQNPTIHGLIGPTTGFQNLHTNMPYGTIRIDEIVVPIIIVTVLIV